MAKEDEKRHKEKKYKKEKDKERDRDRNREHERESKHSRRETDDEEVAKSDTASDRQNAGASEAEGSADQYVPSDSKPKMDESKGEVSMSVDETNKLRISLGLKPLDTNKSSDEDKAARAAAAAARAEEKRKAKEAEMAERIKTQKERRLEQESLRKIKTLGEAGQDVDDLAAWVERNRKAEERQKAEERAKAEKLARQLEEQDDVESDEEAVTNAQELAGMKVKHSADELNEGETMILTLTDRAILDEKGDIAEDPEELENALVTEEKLRRKAFKAGQKENKPLFGEDGKVQGLLEKYDEEAPEDGMQIDATGAVEEAKRKRQDEIRARLKAAESAATSSAPSFNSKGDYYTKEEMAQFQAPKTKKRRKLRKKDTEADQEGALDLAALEAEAAANDTGKDRGSRAQRNAMEGQEAAARAAELHERKERYENALNKANIASLALKQQAAKPEDFTDEADDDLQASLARARRAAQQKDQASSRLSAEEVAAEAARRREEKERIKQEQGGGLEFSEAKDFANSIQLVEAEQPADADVKPEPEPEPMESEEKPPAPTPLPPPPPRAPEPKFGSWVPADKVKDEPVDVAMPEALQIKREQPAVEESAPESLVREKTVGTGLAGAMALLRERGELQQQVEWAGRTNDMRKDKLQGLDDIYRGGQHEDKLAAGIEQALTERDEFGRVLTPKERFRRLCHNFHGKTISKGKQEKRLRKLQEEVDAKRAATGEGSSTAFSRIGGQHVVGTPYVVLSGKVQPGQSSDPASGFATVDRHAPTPVAGGATPVLGGGQTPLVGDRKVEIMLGLKRETGLGNGAMLPPPPRSVRK